MRIEPFTLTGRHVRLEPLAVAHVPALVAAAQADSTTYGFTSVPHDVAAMTAYVEGLLADAARDAVVPFAQVRAGDGVPVGCTRFMNLVWWPARLTPAEAEVGGTWLAAAAQRTPINTEAKLLLLRHAFEVWQVGRVAICTDARNERSRIAIERIGATFEGVLRSHRPATGHLSTAHTLRDSAMYSIIAEEWPRVRDLLQARLTG